MRKNDNMISIFLFIDIITTRGPKPPSGNLDIHIHNVELTQETRAVARLLGLEGPNSKFMLYVSEGNH
jgi:hypothetical protein